MGDRTGIAWTDATWNPVAGCTRVSEGCDNCYAASLAADRLKNLPQYADLAVVTPSGRAAFNGKIRLLPERLDQPLRWRKPRLVFVNSMSDLFHAEVPFEYVDRVWDIMARAKQHTFQVLTKRPERLREYLSAAQPLPNVWLGASIENRSVVGRADHLRSIPAAVRFISYEPALGPLADVLDLTDIDWLIYGGESGPGYRPHDVQWARDIRAKCDAAGVAFFYKQSTGHRSGMGVELDGQIVQSYPTPRRALS